MVINIEGYPSPIGGIELPVYADSIGYTVRGAKNDISGVIEPSQLNETFSYEVVVPVGEDYVATVTASLARKSHHFVSGSLR